MHQPNTVSLRRLVRGIIEVFGDEYLRSPNEHDTARLLVIGESRGFPDAWEHRLYALGVEKLSYSMARLVQGSSS